MGFLVNKITGNGIAQVAVTNDVTLEAVVNSLVAYNSTGGALTFSVLVDGSTIFTESVAANSSYRIPDKVNLSASKVLSVNAATGVSVTVSYLQQAIDVAGALSAAQQAALDATTNGAAQVTLAEDQVALAVAAKDLAEAALGTTASPSITGLIKEEVSVSTLTLGATSSVQTYTATGNFTIVDDLVSGESVVFYITNGGFLPTYPTMVWDGDAEPTLGTTDRLFFEKVGTTLYGFHTATFA